MLPILFEIWTKVHSDANLYHNFHFRWKFQRFNWTRFWKDCSIEYKIDLKTRRPIDWQHNETLWHRCSMIDEKMKGPVVWNRGQTKLILSRLKFTHLKGFHDFVIKKNFIPTLISTYKIYNFSEKPLLRYHRQEIRNKLFKTCSYLFFQISPIRALMAESWIKFFICNFKKIVSFKTTKFKQVFDKSQ